MDRYEDFRNLPDDELIRRIDDAAPNVGLGVPSTSTNWIVVAMRPRPSGVSVLSG
jgi:hypothetical protein